MYVPAAAIPVSTRLRRAIVLNDLTLVKRIVHANPEELQNPDFDDKSNTSLHLAAKYGHVEIAEFLIDAGHEDDGISRNTDWDTPLHIAAATRNDKVGILLINRFPRCVPWPNKQGLDALMLAARHSTLALIPALLSPHLPAPASPAAHDASGNTALHHAAAWGQTAAMRALLHAGAPPLATNHFAWTPLAYARRVADEVYFKNLVAELEKRRVEEGKAGGRPREGSNDKTMGEWAGISERLAGASASASAPASASAGPHTTAADPSSSSSSSPMPPAPPAKDAYLAPRRPPAVPPAGTVRIVTDDAVLGRTAATPNAEGHPRSGTPTTATAAGAPPSFATPTSATPGPAAGRLAPGPRAAEDDWTSPPRLGLLAQEPASPQAQAQAQGLGLGQQGGWSPQQERRRGAAQGGAGRGAAGANEGWSGGFRGGFVGSAGEEGLARMMRERGGGLE
ncbi:ankyrin repeat-containing domain protein [Lineolata rhizophorae]|uniref:Ankyrin repeat-containing domain protein n=1 Tax=Lineolata rhizophorae TaxID=578093 RepID=A0A6A6NV68_9PEZI|nr:ankyrin repeat-containing domain protein [Lineolata rhizophorae]